MFQHGSYCIDSPTTLYGDRKLMGLSNKMVIVVMGALFGMAFVLLGMVYFVMSLLVDGVLWWNLLGLIVTGIILTIPKILDIRDSQKLHSMEKEIEN